MKNWELDINPYNTLQERRKNSILTLGASACVLCAACQHGLIAQDHANLATSSGFEIIPSFRLRIHPEHTHFHLEITAQLYLTAEIWDTRAEGRYCIPWFVSSSCLAHSSCQKSKSYCQFSLWFCVSCGVLTVQENNIPFSLAVHWFYYIHRSIRKDLLFLGLLWP